MAGEGCLNPKVMARVAKEVKELASEPVEGISVRLNEANMAEIHATITGPAGTPYEGGAFNMKLVLGEDFPNVAPKGYFLTKVFHPNISNVGEICVNTLKKDWKPTHGLRHILLVIRCLLIEPFPESALNEEAGKLLMEDYEGYAKHAKLMTSIHAVPTKAAPNHTRASSDCLPLTIDSANTASALPAHLAGGGGLERKGSGMGGGLERSASGPERTKSMPKATLQRKSSLKRL